MTYEINRAAKRMTALRSAADLDSLVDRELRGVVPEGDNNPYYGRMRNLVMHFVSGQDTEVLTKNPAPLREYVSTLADEYLTRRDVKR